MPDLGLKSPNDIMIVVIEAKHENEIIGENGHDGKIDFI